MDLLIILTYVAFARAILKYSVFRSAVDARHHFHIR